MFECMAESSSGSLGQFTLAQAERFPWNGIPWSREQHGTGDGFMVSLGSSLKERCVLQSACVIWVVANDLHTSQQLVFTQMQQRVNSCCVGVNL